MAVISTRVVHQEYNIAEQELQDRLAYIYGAKENEVDLFRPALADQQKIGFFSLDRASQTDITEVVDLKEMTEVLQVLLQDVAALRRDINFTKHVMQADYESKLKEKSLDLYCRINERVSELEKLHEDRVNTVRNAYRQQLSDAIARISALYKKNFERKMRLERNKHNAGADLLDEKYREMQQTIQRNEAAIHMLKLQLAQYQQQPVDNKQCSRSEMTRSGTDPTPTLLLDEESLRSRTPGLSAEAVEELRNKIQKYEKKVDRLEEALDIKDEETTQLNKEVETLMEQMEKQRMLVEQLKHEKNEMKAFAEHDKASSKRMADELLDKQKQDMQRMMEEQLRLAKEEALREARKVKPGSLEADKEKIKLLTDQKKMLEEMLEREKAKNANAIQESADTEKLKKSEQRMRDEVLRLKKEIERIHRTWEKKFAILQQSLHALKDESYLRHTMQRQAATLHQASVSYSVDTPVGIVPTKTPVSSRKHPLPDIPRSGKSQRGGDKDYISYTVSAPSGRGTAMFSVDENQVMSDDQDMPEDVVPLPGPPMRNPTDCGDDSRPSTQGHVVVLPSVEAQ
ncbi:uncharacterized protein C10orf67, mitochondrial-like isoform X3 [Haliotis rufescens]|uniref:uncharacterized protein C10orf67, mitochondrial-like isoform X3 n=1 Tax=Haliotis rufescens TaxID=6454 RepID=UPI001EB01616|nr:uncharacterized protein C10orf67, mitochondrial-like isoform X3 [Haliotis rufescens]